MSIKVMGRALTIPVYCKNYSLSKGSLKVKAGSSIKFWYIFQIVATVEIPISA